MFSALALTPALSSIIIIMKCFFIVCMFRRYLIFSIVFTSLLRLCHFGGFHSQIVVDRGCESSSWRVASVWGVTSSAGFSKLNLTFYDTDQPPAPETTRNSSLYVFAMKKQITRLCFLPTFLTSHSTPFVSYASPKHHFLYQHTEWRDFIVCVSKFRGKWLGKFFAHIQIN